ncbi:MAG: hypothetical protein Q4D02_07475 [Clostridia bacterium]|nr:hypothetical protein [Clostridia bacterium]
MEKSERIEKTLKKVMKKIIHGKYDVLVINELATLAEHCERNNYSNEELKGAVSLIFHDSFTLADYKRIRRRLKTELLEMIEIEDLSYLQVLRIIESIEVLGFESSIKNKNDKIKFCREFGMMAGQFYTKMSDCFKCINLI